jgi:ABC-type uncharacterized transport system substrate-binding protein
LPGMFGTRDNVEAGGLMSYAVDLNDLIRRAALYVDKILKGLGGQRHAAFTERKPA